MNAAFARLYGQPPKALRDRRSGRLSGRARDECKSNGREDDQPTV
jgi:hypothetical protein